MRYTFLHFFQILFLPVEVKNVDHGSLSQGLSKQRKHSFYNSGRKITDFLVGNISD